MKKLYNSTKWLMLVSGLLIAILGITMLFTPLENLITLAVFIGISMLISGISEIVNFFSEDKDYRSGWLLTSGILSTLFGLWTVIGSGTSALVSLMPFIFAVWVMSSGILRIVGSITLKDVGEKQWGWLLAFGILGTILGFILLFSPLLSAVIVAYTIAFMLISHGLNDIVIFFRMNALSKRLRNHFGE